MANKARVNGGLRPIGALRHAAPYVAGGVVYPGDLVQFNSSGLVVAVSAGSVPNLGAALSYASASGVSVLVADSPAQEFVIECSVSAGVASQTAMGLNYNILSGSPSATYKLSANTLDDSSGSATPSTSGALQLKALRLEGRDDNAFGINADIVVVINNHSLAGAGSAGV